MCGFDHGDVVGAVSDCQGYFLQFCLDEGYELGFLEGEQTTADDRLAITGELYEEIFAGLG